MVKTKSKKLLLNGIKSRSENKELKLHMIGKLQSNKAKKAVELFDYIHSVDNQKLADTLSKCQLKY